jgi:hypothetical protein
MCKASVCFCSISPARKGRRRWRSASGRNAAQRVFFLLRRKGRDFPAQKPRFAPLNRCRRLPAAVSGEDSSRRVRAAVAHGRRLEVAGTAPWVGAGGLRATTQLTTRALAPHLSTESRRAYFLDGGAHGVPPTRSVASVCFCSISPVRKRRRRCALPAHSTTLPGLRWQAQRDTAFPCAAKGKVKRGRG